MSIFDVVLLGIILGFMLFGLWFGLVHTLGSLVGTLLATFLATRWYVPAAAWLSGITGWTGNFPKVLMFIMLFLLINRLVGIGFFLIDKTLSVVTHLPFIHSLNKLLGGVFGFLEGLVVVGVSLYFITKYPLGNTFMTAFKESKVAPYCVQVANVVQPFVPEAIKQIKNTFSL